MEASRREIRRQDRHAAIIAVARQSFFEVGYAATSMSTIAATLGGSKGTLWRYFPSKEALFGAVVEDATISFQRELAETLDISSDIRMVLTNFCRRLIHKSVTPGSISMYRMIAAESGRIPEVGRIFFERVPAQMRRVISRYLSDHIAAGTLRETDPQIAARILTQLCMSGSHLRLLLGAGETPSEEEINADADTAVDIFMRAYAPEASRPEMSRPEVSPPEASRPEMSALAVTNSRIAPVKSALERSS